jgi:hypothetical protein
MVESKIKTLITLTLIRAEVQQGEDPARVAFITLLYRNPNPSTPPVLASTELSIKVSLPLPHLL